MYHNAIQGTNENTGVRILVEEKIAAIFTRVNDRICFPKIQLDKYKVVLLVAFAPTLAISDQNPATKEDFYESLSEVTNRINESRHMLITIEDFNAKTRIRKSEYPVKIGKYGKGRLKTNGICFLEYANI